MPEAKRLELKSWNEEAPDTCETAERPNSQLKGRSFDIVLLLADGRSSLSESCARQSSASRPKPLQ